MDVLILCDRESAGDAGFHLREQAEDAVRQAGCTVQTIVLNSDEIKPCLGCFSCWVKTPGLCIITNDDANRVSRAQMRADVVVILSKLTYGGFSADIKAFLDRCIPNISPFFETYHGEMHHKMRYEKFPYWIAVGYGESTEEERQTFRELAERNALNMRPPKQFCLTPQSAGDCPDARKELGRILSEEVRV